MCGTETHEKPKCHYFVGYADFTFFGCKIPEFGSKKKAVIFNNKKDAMQAVKAIRGKCEIETI